MENQRSNVNRYAARSLTVNREHVIRRSKMIGENSLLVIAPYWYNGTWVFDDGRVGLVREPFVAGVPEMIDHVVRDIAAARNGFRMTFSDIPFPGYTHSLEWVKEEAGGNWYRMCGGLKMEGWLCPALFHYFTSAPEFLYMRADSRDI